MRSVLLLLILCVSFETLDSVSRFRHPSLEFPRVFAVPPTAMAEKTAFVSITHRNAVLSGNVQLTTTPMRHQRWSHHATARQAFGDLHFASAPEIASARTSALDLRAAHHPMVLAAPVRLQTQVSTEAPVRLQDNTDILAAVADIKPAAATDAPPPAPPGFLEGCIP